MAKSTRVNLSVPAQFDVVLDRLVEQTGRSKASFILEAIGWSLPHWMKLARMIDTGPRKEPEASEGRTTIANAQPSRPLTHDREHGNPQQLSRQQRRAQEREAVKGKNVRAVEPVYSMQLHDDLGD